MHKSNTHLPSYYILFRILYFHFALLALPAHAAPELSLFVESNLDQLLGKLTQSDYKTPHSESLLIESALADTRSEAHAYTILERPLNEIEAQIRHTMQWCELLILHSHIKGCVYTGNEQVILYFGDKNYQAMDDAEAVEFIYKHKFETDKSLQVRFSAAQGPMGSFDLLLNIEIVALNAQRSLIHLSYVTHHGSMAQLMLSAYLNTLGRHKVGFSVETHAGSTKPAKIKGVRGIVERNVMRYLLALLSYLDSANETTQARFVISAKNWHRYSQRYTEQLKELELTVYLKGKMQEHANQLQQQSEINRKTQLQNVKPRSR